MSRVACTNRVSEPTERDSTGHSPGRDIVELVVSKQRLNQTDILAALEQMGRE
jgi:hypothetical protein